MSAAKQGDTVKVHYTGRLDDGSIFDSSIEREPLKFRIGQKGVIPALEQAVVGMAPGEKKQTRLNAERAYGPHRANLVVVVTQDKLPDDLSAEVGQFLQIRKTDGQEISARVTAVSGGDVTLDANHPLAGKDLTFDLQLVEIL